MDTAQGLLIGLQAALEPMALLYCFVGVFIGTLVGVLPGIGAMATISLLLPLTYHIPPTSAIIMLAGVYYGGQYGGSTASILLNLPGSPSSSVTCLDGYPMAQQGRAGVALCITAVASFVGALLGIAILVLFSPAIAELGLQFGPADYFSMMLLGLIAASGLGSGAPTKGLAMVVLGLLLGTVGTDVNSGVSRFDFGVLELMDGINLVALAMGVFGLSEVIAGIHRPQGQGPSQAIAWRDLWPSRQDLRQSALPMLRGTAIGSFFGALPGTGAAIASFVSYAVEKKVARDPTRFGQGAIEGVASPEAANNAAAQTAFVPTLSLGIPGDAIMALMLGALIIHGIQPGPMLMNEQPQLFWGLVVSFGIGNVMLVILNLPLVGMWVAILRIPYHVLYPAILVFTALGVYSVSNSTFDIYQVAIVGALGYLLTALRFEAAPLMLGFVLGPLMEEYLRRALLLSHGDLSTLVQRPISAGFLLVCAGMLLWNAWTGLKQMRHEAA
ncbi:tripartite tricarboxylate transporter permease [Macromonas nakdongensis]|uniref:tripartite tricarboxylate transporter permease n=1 Tax=Macromonas nakdongensis TaxID=1843082 RepID=UPI000C34BADA|nr:tripartite tricarboxylate transporter permease [Macromonas nakdongensis]